MTAEAPARPAAPRAAAPPPVRAGDVPPLLVSIAALVAVVAVFRAYRAAPPAFFPRNPSEFMSAERQHEVAAAARAALEKDPEDIAALTDLTLVAYQRGPEAAVECVESGEKALALGALDARLFYFTGACYEALGAIEDYRGQNGYATGAYERYLRHHPGDDETRLRLGNLSYRTGDLEKAQAHFQKVLAARPGDPLVAFNLSVVLRDRSLWKEGLDVLLPVLERDKTLPAGGFRVLGDLHKGAGAFDDALAAYRRELERSPDDAEILSLVAQTLDDAKRDEEALEAWKRVLEVNPKSNQAYVRARALRRALRNKKKA